MHLRSTLPFCLVPLLSPLAPALHEEPASATGNGAAPVPSERSVPAVFAWADVDGDAWLDLAAVTDDGRLQLLLSAGEGRFADVTESAGLAGVRNAALALWTDYDADGRLDLFVGAHAGASRLFHNEGGTFVDLSAASGLEIAGEVRAAEWLDLDGDGRPDLHVVTAAEHLFFRGLEGGFFERSALPVAGADPAPPVMPGTEPAAPRGGASASRPAGTTTSAGAETPAAGGAGPRGPHAASVGSAEPPLVDGRVAVGPPPGGVAPLGPFPLRCAGSMKDLSTLGACFEASTTPVLGRLYPLSTNLFVAVGGNVGIGMTSPSAKLHVAGTARITNTLTLAPPGDQALNVSSGSIYKGGVLFLHSKGGGNNTGAGEQALLNVSTGFDNTASGNRALGSASTAHGNTAVGALALFVNTTGNDNTACGVRSLYYNTTGHGNTAGGAKALFANTTGYANTASGYNALVANTIGTDNTATGYKALLANTTGSSNTASGYRALEANRTGTNNTACGAKALLVNTASDNTAVGIGALSANSTGARNIALGRNAGSSLTTGNDNVTIGHTGSAGETTTIRVGTQGTQTRAFVAGIRGVTTGVANAIPVLVDSNGQLGTVSSSARFKEEIRDMGDLTDRLLELRPVVFRYKPEVQAGERPLEYGLIAEEVAEVFPELVVDGDDGQPFTVKYHLLASMLLNELEKEVGARKELDARVAAQTEEHARELSELRGELAGLRSLVARLAAAEPGPLAEGRSPAARDSAR